MLENIFDKTISNKPISSAEALSIINTPDEDIYLLLHYANKIRAHYKGNKIKVCSIINAKSGSCSENCSFCGQSSHFCTKVDTYPLLSEKEMIDSAKQAESDGATCFSIVTSGRTINTESDWNNIYKTVETMKEDVGTNRCTSLGILSETEAAKLKEVGLDRYHHNLETAESFFQNVCTTHSYEERVNTIKNAKKSGLLTCSGGIFGLGETKEQRIELAMLLRDLDVDSVPINILNPIAGTPAFENYQPLRPFEILKLIATYRFLLPTKDIGIFGGRETNLRDIQALIFAAGANVFLLGNYLLTKGRRVEDDMKMLSDLELNIDKKETKVPLPFDFAQGK